MFKDLNGQFAFAIWDNRKQELLLARDRVGIRPLFYHHDGGRLLFGSEIKAIFADPNVPRCMDLQTLRRRFHLLGAVGRGHVVRGHPAAAGRAFCGFHPRGSEGAALLAAAFQPGGRRGEDPEPSLADWIGGAVRVARRCHAHQAPGGRAGRRLSERGARQHALRAPSSSATSTTCCGPFR